MCHQNVSSVSDYDLVSGGCSFMTDRHTHTPHVHVNVSLFNVPLQPFCFISLSFLLFICIKYWPLTSSTRSGLRLLRMIPSPVMLQNWLSLPGSGEIFNLPPAITTPPDVSTQQSSTIWREKAREMVVMMSKQSHSRNHSSTESHLERRSKSRVPCSAVVRSHRPISALDHQFPPTLEPGAALNHPGVQSETSSSPSLHYAAGNKHVSIEKDRRYMVMFGCLN